MAAHYANMSSFKTKVNALLAKQLKLVVWYLLRGLENSNIKVGGFWVNMGLMVLDLIGIGNALTLVLKLDILA
jgi:hypothetical protein